MLTKIRSRWAKWLIRGIALYLLCWAVTWALAPAALNRWWAEHHRPTTRDIRGNEEPVEFRTGVPFKGEKFEYGPDFTPPRKMVVLYWEALVSSPLCGGLRSGPDRWAVVWLRGNCLLHLDALRSHLCCRRFGMGVVENGGYRDHFPGLHAKSSDEMA